MWLDVGDPAAYLEANLAVLDGEVTLALDPFPRAGWSRRADGREHGTRPDAALAGPGWIGTDARVDGAALTRSVIGAGASVPAGSALTDCVVWDGVAVPAGRHARTVFHPGGALPL